MSPGVSVIICCHNSSKKLPQTLRHLAVQQAPSDCPWEVIVIDNASTDDTAKVAAQNWPATTTAPLRVISEPQAGLNYARRCGILAARYEIISLIDDDNWVSVDWISRVYLAFATNPKLGAYGGRSEACTEVPPPRWFDSVKGYYAVGRQHPDDGDITESQGTLLWGAGLNLRAAAFNNLLAHGFQFMVQDRRGSQLSTGGDTELCLALRASGWHLCYDHALGLQHFIPRERLRWDYALRLLQGMGQASVLFELYLSALNLPPFQGRSAWKKTWVFQFLKALRLLGAALFFHPRDCIFGREGSSASLKYESIKGRLSMLWNMRGRYQKAASQIAQSSWAQTGK